MPAVMRRPAALLAVLVVGLLGGCALIPPTPGTTQADSVYALYIVIFTLGAIVFFVVEGFIIYAVIRYRRRDDRLPTQHHGNNRVEIIWTVIPTVIVMILFIGSLVTLASIEQEGADPVNIEVEGFQWQWAFHYLDEGVTVDGGSVENPPVMVVPVNRPIHLILHSDDVIHSFFVPNFLTKRDVVPFAEGTNPNELEFTVNRLGTFRGQCAEFCGRGHAEMTFVVISMDPADYADWVVEQRAAASVEPTPTIPAGLQIVRISADQLEFDTNLLEVPAGEDFVIEFTNNEVDIPHNVAIYDGEATLFQGEWLTGPGTIQYLVPALDAGEYTFQCDVHPSMFGTVTAR